MGGIEMISKQESEELRDKLRQQPVVQPHPIGSGPHRPAPHDSDQETGSGDPRYHIEGGDEDRDLPDNFVPLPGPRVGDEPTERATDENQTDQSDQDTRRDQSETGSSSQGVQDLVETIKTSRRAQGALVLLFIAGWVM